MVIFLIKQKKTNRPKLLIFIIFFCFCFVVKHFEGIDIMIDASSKPSSTRIYEFLQSTELVGHLSTAILKKLANALQVVPLEGCQILMQQNEKADCMYFVMHGRLRVFVTDDVGHEIVVGEISSGEVVGEMALLTDDPRSATVRTIRDCVLLKLTRDTFDKFVIKYPETALEISRQCIHRLSSSMRSKKVKKSKLHTITILPTHENPLIIDSIKKLSHTISKHGRVLVLNQDVINQKLGIDISQLTPSDSRYANIVAWVNEQEDNYDYIVYEANITSSLWTDLCLRQADCIFVFTSSQDDPKLTEIEQELFYQKPDITCRKSLVILHPKKSKTPKNTVLWLEKRKVDDFFHIACDSDADAERLARILTGNSIGIVLSGGGARGLAHVGLLRALEENNIPFDMVGGTSMGAVIASACSMEWNSDVIKQLCNSVFVKGDQVDFTFPMLSLSTGKNIVEQLKNSFGDETRIEDSWRRNYCVSTNLSTQKMMIHDQGLLWHAIRSSTSLPAIFPPVLSKEGFLIDGAILNNMPVDVMQRKLNAGKVLASQIVTSIEKPHCEEYGDWISGWKLLWSKFSSQNKTNQYPRIDSIITQAIMLNGERYEEQMAQSADECIKLDCAEYDIMDFKAYENIIELGYQSSKKQLENLQWA